MRSIDLSLYIYATPGFDVYPEGALWVIEVLVDFIFMTDVVLNFRTTVLASETKETITDLREIATRQEHERSSLRMTKNSIIPAWLAITSCAA